MSTTSQIDTEINRDRVFFARDGGDMETYWEREERRAALREEILRAELELIDREESTFPGYVIRALTRIVVRTLRLLTGLALGSLGAWAGKASLDKLSIPFAGQSVVGVIAGLGLAVLAIYLLGTALSAAFGRGPDAEAEHLRKLKKAAFRLAQQDKWKILGG